MKKTEIAKMRKEHMEVTEYVINAGRHDPRKNNPLGKVGERTEAREDAEGREMLPGSYLVIGFRSRLSTKMDDGSRVTLHQIVLEQL